MTVPVGVVVGRAGEQEGAVGEQRSDGEQQWDERVVRPGEDDADARKPSREPSDHPVLVDRVVRPPSNGITPARASSIALSTTSKTI